jgi:diamine N-acetyltransferase
MNEQAKFRIRHAGADDFGLIAVLGTVTFYEAYFAQDPPIYIVNYILEAFEPKMVQAELEDLDSSFYLIFSEEKAIGYAKLRKNSSVESVTGVNTIEIQRFYIVERFHGCGAGEALLRHCVAAARNEGFSSVWLGVWEENPRAQRFYHKHGFETIGGTTFPYGDAAGRNLVMQKSL